MPIYMPMKLTAIFVFLALTMCCFSGIVESKKKKICDKNPSEDTFVCPPAESFVCGSDGKTYKNICLLGKAMRASCGKIRYEHLGQCVVQKTS